jgi:hypothetical protein
MANERNYDKTVADRFPASDPPANSGVTGAEPAKLKPPQQRDEDARPTGTPTSDRHATETAHVSEDGVTPVQ